MFILGLGHRARHGKDSVARAIVEYCATQGIYAKQYGFCDALKAHCRVAFGMREKDAPLLQMVGTDLYRRKDPDIWIRVLMDTLDEQKPDVALITDTRFQNEAEAILWRGGSVIKVERRNADDGLWVAQDRDPNHSSETALTNYPFDLVVSAKDGQLTELLDSGIKAFDTLYRSWRRRVAR